MDSEEDAERKAETKKYAVQRKRDARKMETGHVMSWVTPLIKGRLYVGPFIADREDALYLEQMCHVTHIVNLKPNVDGKTKTGLPKHSWYYPCFFMDRDQAVYREREGAPKLVRDYALPGDFAETKNEKEQTQWYMQHAQRLAHFLQDNEHAVVYIHNDKGNSEEAFLGMLAWFYFQPAKYPKNVTEWMTQNNYTHLMAESEEQRAIFDKVLAKARTASPLISWLKKQKKI